MRWIAWQSRWKYALSPLHQLNTLSTVCATRLRSTLVFHTLSLLVVALCLRYLLWYRSCQSITTQTSNQWPSGMCKLNRWWHHLRLCKRGPCVLRQLCSICGFCNDHCPAVQGNRNSLPIGLQQASSITTGFILATTTWEQRSNGFHYDFQLRFYHAWKRARSATLHAQQHITWPSTWLTTIQKGDLMLVRRPIQEHGWSELLPKYRGGVLVGYCNNFSQWHFKFEMRAPIPAVGHSLLIFATWLIRDSCDSYSWLTLLITWTTPLPHKCHCSQSLWTNFVTGQRRVIHRKQENKGKRKTERRGESNTVPVCHRRERLEHFLCRSSRLCLNIPCYNANTKRKVTDNVSGFWKYHLDLTHF